MELKHIESFVALAQELSFSKAAKKLHISQSPLSRHIKSLEDELGQALFDRNTKSVTLTPAGEAFLIEANMLLNQIKGAVDKLKAPIGKITTKLTIGFIRSAMLLFLPQLLKAFHQQHPYIQVNISEINHYATVKKQLLNNQIDLAFTQATLPDERLRYHRIMSEQMKVVLPLTHPFANRQVLSLPALKDESFILFPRKYSPAMYDLFVHECWDKADFQPKIAMEATPQLARVEMVMHGQGITLASSSLEKMFEGQVVFKNIVSTQLVPLPIDMVWHPANVSPQLQALINLAKSFIYISH
ncbi:MAG TPA: hypothetical protein DCS93_14855 [Microscillaceae bacterium]|nr:hypothetical protein [Microscillaceae bacterium]